MSQVKLVGQCSWPWCLYPHIDTLQSTKDKTTKMDYYRIALLAWLVRRKDENSG
jgi:hypothetical protein